MDIAALSMSMSQTSLASAVSTSMMKMTMNTSEVAAQRVIKMIDEMELNPAVGSNLDITV